MAKTDHFEIVDILDGDTATTFGGAITESLIGQRSRLDTECARTDCPPRPPVFGGVGRCFPPPLVATVRTSVPL